MESAEVTILRAISLAKSRGAEEVAGDDLLLGALESVARFGIARLGAWDIDVEALGSNWIAEPEKAKVAYSDEAVAVLDLAAKIARSDGGAKLATSHLLAAFAGREDGLMGRLKAEYGITSASWRTAIAGLPRAEATESATAPAAADGPLSEYVTPEEAAEELGVHVQTMRAYIRNGRVPAFRIAGERALRIRRTDLAKVLEPL